MTPFHQKRYAYQNLGYGPLGSLQDNRTRIRFAPFTVVRYIGKREVEQHQNQNDMQKQILDLYKNEPTDTIFWIDNPDTKGEFLFTFDKKKVYNLFADYPHKLTDKEKAIFDRENPYWVEFFKGRNG